MNKTQIKELAQDLILQQVAVAYYQVEGEPISPSEQMEVYEELRRQGRRIAKLFGYDEQPFSG